MRIALYHHLPAGGALRFARQSVMSTSQEHTYVMFVPDGETTDPVLAESVAEVRHVPLGWASGILPGRAGELARVLEGQRAIAREIDRGDFALVLFHPSRITQAPTALLHVDSAPTLYFAQEPRRRSYERGYQSWTDTRHGAWRAVTNLARGANERLMTKLDRDALERATVVAANSAFSVESIARAYGRDAVLCHLGVPVDDEAIPARRADPVLLSVGALDPTKGHDLVVEALGLLREEERPSLVIVHERVDPPFRAALEVRARDLGVGLTIRSNISDSELAALYVEATATVAAARLEPFGLTTLESIAHGTPVVAVREGGFRETVAHGLNGVLVDRDARSLASGIAEVFELADLVAPDAIRKSLLPYWSWGRCVDDYRALLERAAG